MLWLASFNPLNADAEILYTCGGSDTESPELACMYCRLNSPPYMSSHWYGFTAKQISLAYV